MLMLRQACCAVRHDPRLWTLYGIQCVRAGRAHDAVLALKQAVWLRERAHEDGRARATRALLDRVVLGDLKLPLKAA